MLVGKFSDDLLHIYCEETPRKQLPKNKLVRAKYYILAEKSIALKEIKRKIFSYCNTTPLSKFGVEAEFYICKSKSSFRKILPEKRLYCYKKENTHKYFDSVLPDKLQKKHRIVSTIKVSLDEKQKEKKQKEKTYT